MAIFVVGHVWRYRHDQFGWTTRSTQLLESRRLRAGVLLFHLGLLAVLGGHVLGLLVPASLTEDVGVTEDMYHVVSVTAGTISGVVMTAGFVLLLARRASDRRVRATTTRIDRLTYLLLGVMIVTGMYATVGENLIGGGYEYRETVAPWFRGLFTFDPDAALMAEAPLVFQLHAAAAWFLYALWPFSRLVHAWSVPVGYLTRSPILYRSRRAAAERPARPRAAA
jgi:nitrate reductase gamma subunit